MKNFFDKHISVLLFLSTWLCWPICIYIFRNAYVTPMPMSMCVKIATLLIGFCSVVFFFMGLVMDLENRSRLKRAFLRKLES